MIIKKFRFKLLLTNHRGIPLKGGMTSLIGLFFIGHFLKSQSILYIITKEPK